MKPEVVAVIILSIIIGLLIGILAYLVFSKNRRLEKIEIKMDIE
jgi:uncharacterized membrane protein (DUF106 family)